MRRIRAARFLAAAIAVSTVSALTGGVNPAGAQTEPDPPPIEEEAPPECDVSLNSRLINVPQYDERGRFFDHSRSRPQHLAEPLSGRVVASGVVGDLNHLNDQIDFTITETQFEEQIKVEFLNADGDVVGTSEPTIDLPDIAPFAPFNLPSVDLTDTATAVRIVHAGVTKDEPNSIEVPCVNFTMLSDDSAPSDYINFNVCPVDGPIPLPFESVCGAISVPEERSNPHSRLISVAFAIVPGDGTHADPLVYLEGGPGGAPISVGGIIHALAMEPVADGRDVVYIDQRGTGYSQPNLVCQTERESVAEPPMITSEEEFLAFELENLQRCADRLRSENIDLNAYTSVENGADVADLRIALGVEEWNLFGGSYGTDLALTVMRDRPEGIRSVVLDSVFPPEVNPIAGDQGIGYLDALDDLVARCDADPACGGAFPNVRQNIIDAVDNLLAEPVLVTGTEAEILFGEPVALFDGLLLMNILSFDFANPLMPALLNALASPDPAVREDGARRFFTAVAIDVIGLPPEAALQVKAEIRHGIPGPATQFSDGFNTTVICAEEFPFEGTATTYDGPGWSPAIFEFADGFLSFYRIVCPIFDITPEDPVVTEPVVSDLPTLVTYTDNDSQTVPRWSELTAESLTNVDLVFFPNLAHVVTFGNECAHSVVGQFLANPEGELDTSCTAELPPIVYFDSLPDLPPLPPLDELLAQLEEAFGEEGDGPPPGEGPPPEGEEAPPGEVPPPAEEAPPGDSPPPAEEAPAADEPVEEPSPA